MSSRRYLKVIRSNTDRIVIFLTPLVLLPLALEDSLVAKCGFGVLLIGIYWIADALPLPITAMLPLVLFPLLGVEKVNILASVYTKDVSFVVLGSIAVALGVEKCNLHRRFALKVLLLMGSEIKWLMLGLMLGTAFLSMWIQNSATTAMMLPVSMAVFQEILKIRRDERKETSEAKKVDSEEVAVNVDNSTPIPVKTSDDAQFSIAREDLSAEELNLGLAMTLCISYSATTGGTGSLTGTGTNVVAKGLFDEFPVSILRLLIKERRIADGKSGVTFNSWAMFSVPIVFINIIICWIWIQVLFFGPRSFFMCQKSDTKRSIAAIKKMLYLEYRKLGPIRFAEVSVLVHFLVVVTLWITFDSELYSGWATLFKPGFTGIAIPAVAVMTVMFFFPSKNPFAEAESSTVCDGVNTENLDMRMKKEAKEAGEKSCTDTLLTWDLLQHRMPWGIFFLIGSGLAIAKSCDVSGLSNWIGEQLSVLEGLPVPIIGFLLALFISFLTEITNNVATVSITQPLILGMARNLKIHPLYFMMPCALASSYAYMLPCAGLPNALAFSYGLVKVTDMVKTGFVMNVASVIVLSMAVNIWGDSIFNFGDIPAWGINNSTISSTPESIS